MTEPIAWNQYSRTDWAGGSIADGATIALKMRNFALGWGPKYSGVVARSGFAAITQFSRFSYSPANNYAAIAMGAATGTALTLRTWPRVPGETMPGNTPANYQKVILQTADGLYLAADDTGTYCTVADEGDADVLILDLTLGATTVLRPAFYTYRWRETLDPHLATIGGSSGKMSIQFIQPIAAHMPDPGPDPSGVGPIVFQYEFGTPQSAVIGLELLQPAVVTTMPFADGQRVRAPSGAIYLVIDGVLRWIPNPPTYNNLFADWGNLVAIAEPDALYPVGPVLSDGAYLARTDTGPEFYLVSDGIRRWIESPAVMTLYNFDGGKVVSLAPDALDAIPEGESIGLNLDSMPYRSGMRVREDDTGKIYLVIDGALRWIPDPDTFNNLFADWTLDDSKPALPATTYRIGAPLSSGAYLAKTADDAGVFLMTDGVKRWIVNPNALARYRFDANKIRVVPAATLAIGQGADIDL